MIRESLANKVTNARNEITAENQEIIQENRRELLNQVLTSKETLVQQVIQAQKELDASMQQIKDCKDMRHRAKENALKDF